MTTTKKRRGNARPQDSLLVSLLGFGVLFGLLVLVLDFFGVGVFDGKGPGTALILFGIGLFSLTVETIQTGWVEYRFFGFGLAFGRSDTPVVFWISVAIYAFTGVVMVVAGILTLQVS